MTKRWYLAALASLGLATQAMAQMPMPMQPSGPMPMQQLPGPMGPMPGMPPMGMQGPGQPMVQPEFADNPHIPQPPDFCPAPDPSAPAPSSLPDDGLPNAFQDEDGGCPKRGVILGVGAMGLARQSLNSIPYGVYDPGLIQPNGSVLLHTGSLPPSGAQTALDFHDVPQEMHLGVRADLQWREQDFCFEITGYFIGQESGTNITVQPGHLTLDFAAFPLPTGFTGNHGIFIDADQVQTSYRYQLANGETNFRFRQNGNFEWIAGLRLLDFQDRLGIHVDNDSQETLVADPTLTADYTIHTHSRITAPQLGFETEWMIVPHVLFGATLKGAWGANFEETTIELMRGDGLVGPGIHESSTVFSQVYEANLFADFLITGQLKLRAGYDALWLVGIPQAQQEVNFDLNNPGGHLNSKGSAFFHGPTLELQLLF